MYMYLSVTELFVIELFKVNRSDLDFFFLILSINAFLSVTGAGSSTNLHAGGTNCAAVLTYRVEPVIA